MAIDNGRSAFVFGLSDIGFGKLLCGAVLSYSSLYRSLRKSGRPRSRTRRVLFDAALTWLDANPRLFTAGLRNELTVFHQHHFGGHYAGYKDWKAAWDAEEAVYIASEAALPEARRAVESKKINSMVQIARRAVLAGEPIPKLSWIDGRLIVERPRVGRATIDSEKKLVPVTLRLESELRGAIEDRARDDQCSLGALIRGALHAFLSGSLVVPGPCAEYGGELAPLTAYIDPKAKMALLHRAKQARRSLGWMLRRVLAEFTTQPRTT